jgi:hypothetical protein
MPKSFYPNLSSLVSIDQFPEQLQFVENGLQNLLSKVYYKKLQFVKSEDGSQGYFNLVLVTDDVLKIDLFETGMSIVVNPGSVGEMLIPLTLNYNWPIIGLINSFSQQGFSYLPEAMEEIFGESLFMTDNELIQTAVETFEGGSDHPAYVAFRDKINAHYTLTGLDEIDMPSILDDAQQMADKIRLQIELSAVIFDEVNEVIKLIYVASNDDAIYNDKLDQLAQSISGEAIQDYIKRLIIPQLDASIDLSVGLSFPRNILTPLQSVAGDPIPDPAQSMLIFSAGTLFFSTSAGIGFEGEMSVSLNHPSMIGNTGLGIDIQGVKLDLSRNTNIPEATADGRPVDFMGVFVQRVGITLPEKWFKNQTPGTTAEVFGTNLLIGTGGISGTLGLEAVGGNDILWAEIGENDGFKIGFDKFDISFKQNKVISSSIKAAMEIKKFVYPQSSPLAGQVVRIGIDGHIAENGDFNLTASTTPPYPIELENVFIYHLASIELGTQGDNFYIGTSGSIEFQGFLKDTLKLGSIDIDRLRIYSDGSVEFEGGSINLIEPIVLALGPVEITVTAIHYGSHQREINGVMRKFNYFGFDGGISVDPLGIEIRGDGVKFYYCTDSLPDKPKSYVHIQTLYLDLTIPADTPAVIFNGWLSIPEPGVSQEYAGGIKLQLPQAKISGSADMKLQPKFPAFIIDVSIDLPAPIAIGPVGIYGFRGLIGYRYVAEKEAVGLVSGVDSWYDYYKKPPRGIHVTKFNGPDKTKTAGTPFSLGIGASLGTSFDNGTVVNIKAMILLSIPSLFMIDGRAAILSARLGLDDSGDPPFFAFIAIGDNSLEFGFGADFNMPSDSGDILKIYADVQAGFFFNDSSKWYVNIGTKTNPITARVLTLLTVTSYLMLSAKGIEAGARGELVFNRQYGPIKVAAWAYIEVGGKISFEKPQFGAYMAAGVGAEIDIMIFSLYASFDVLFGVEAPKPFLLYGEFHFCVKIKIAWVFSFKFCGDLSIMWEFNSNVDRTPIDPFINPGNASTIPTIVQGVNMLSNETFDLAYLGSSIPANLPQAVLDHILPLDTYIDIKSEKGFLPAALTGLIGGINNPPERYTEMVPPQKIIRGKEVRQVKHQYSIENLSVKSWNSLTSQWDDYNPYEALYPGDPTIANHPIGHFQKSGNQYNTVRILATNSFSYTEQGQPGWFIPEQYGITPASLFCEGEQLVPICANFLLKPFGTEYFCYDENQIFYTDQVAYLLLDRLDDDHAEITDESNVFGFAQSLQFQNTNKLQIRLPEPSVEVSLKLTSFSTSVRINYYASVIDDTTLVVQYGNPDATALDPTEPFSVTVPSSALNVAVDYNHPEWDGITRIEIEPLYPNQAQIDALIEQIAVINDLNNQIALGIIEGEQQSTKELEARLEKLRSEGCTIIKAEPCKKDAKMCNLYEQILALQQDCLVEPDQYSADVLQSVLKCIQELIKLVSDCLRERPNENLSKYLNGLQAFRQDPSKDKYTELWDGTLSILKYLFATFHCDCQDEPLEKCYTMLHEVCWLSLEQYQYNINIPGQAAIEADAEATIDGISQHIQPIWRPDTSYTVRFLLKDVVDNGATTPGNFAYTYGFTTGGPVGFFHKNVKATYGDIELANDTILEDANGIIRDLAGNAFPPVPGAPLTPHPEKYALTSLTRYIDYDRSYPNANGNLLSSKPLFYDDETTRIYLYFTKAYATHFFHTWQAYNGQVEAAGRIKIVIKDPREDSEVVNPPFLDYDPADTIYTNTPQTVENWAADPDPLLPHVFEMYANLIDAGECIPFGGDSIAPPSEFLEVVPKRLKPLKLYTAVVNNIYDLNKNGVLEPTGVPLTPGELVEETTEVHKFTFQTSRYKNFEEQVNSYMLENEDATATRDAIFSIEKGFTAVEIDASFDTIVDDPNALSDGIAANYQHRFDRVFEGILGFTPMDKAVSTEFNLIRDANDGNKVIAILIRNPEPFNFPKIPVAEIDDTIEVVDNGGNLISNYKVLQSKDYSQAIIMHDSKEITDATLNIRFRYKLWDGSDYIVPSTPQYTTDAVGTIVVSNLDVQNN